MQRHALLIIAGMTAMLLASGLMAKAAQSTGAVPIPVPSYTGESVVAYGSSQLLLVSPLYTGDPGITRINLDGSVDRSFGVDGTVEIASEAATVTPDGKILVCTSSNPGSVVGTSDARVTRLLPDGQPDPSFGVGGNADVDFDSRYAGGEEVALTAGGKILLAGWRVNRPAGRGESNAQPVIARLRPNGSLDRSFGRNGVRVLGGGGEDAVLDLALTPDRGIVLQIGNSIEAFVLKLTSEGSFDRGFGQGGWVEIRGKRQKYGYHEELFVAPQLAVLPSGKLLLAATAYPNRGPNPRFRVVALRLRPDGRVDRTYGDEGWASVGRGHVETSAEGLALLPGGALAVATTFEEAPNEQRDFGVIAFGRDGRMKRQFGKQGRCRAPLAGRQEALGVVTLDRRAVVVGDGVGNPWLLSCPSSRS